LLPFPPAIAREFDRIDTLDIFVRVFPPAGAGAQLQAALTVGREGTVVQAADVTCQRSATVSEAVDCQATVPLADLAPGDYALTVAGRVGTGDPVTRAIPFRVR